MVLKAAGLTKDARGPSQLDSELLASEIVDLHSAEALVACRLIPLNKNPCVRPIGVGEVIRRIIGKQYIEWVVKKDIQEAAGIVNGNWSSVRC